MIIKRRNAGASYLYPFDLLGKKETALAKAFAYVLSQDPKALFSFLSLVGIDVGTSDHNDFFRTTSIEIEHNHQGVGRTDVEIRCGNGYHVIIECKVGNNRVGEQRTKYLRCFDGIKNKIMCFITQDRDSFGAREGDVILKNLSWLDILTKFSEEIRGCHRKEHPIIRQFLSYIQRRYEMGVGREILIQDVSNLSEVERYCTYNVYKRPLAQGTPLYFAPYFTQNARGGIVGLRCISQILGIITLGPEERIQGYRTDLESFSQRSNNNRNGLVERWIEGVNHDNRGNPVEILTYFFLDDPVELPCTLRKNTDPGWIHRQIPKNRRLPFTELIRQLSRQCNNEQ